MFATLLVANSLSKLFVAGKPKEKRCFRDVENGSYIPWKSSHNATKLRDASYYILLDLTLTILAQIATIFC